MELKHKLIFCYSIILLNLLVANPLSFWYPELYSDENEQLLQNKDASLVSLMDKNPTEDPPNIPILKNIIITC